MIAQPQQQKLQIESLCLAVAEAHHDVVEVIVKPSIDSTNSWSLQQCKSGRALPFVCFAEQQAQGRGRRGKSWLMPAGANVALSLVWPMKVSHERLSLLPLSIAMAIVETLESLGLTRVQVKWPNDVYVSGKKIAGILLETQQLNIETGFGQIQPIGVVIGVGLNFDMSAYAQESKLKDNQHKTFSYTDICTQSNMQSLEIKPERTEVAARLLKKLLKTCQNYPQQATLCLKKFERQYDFCKDKVVDIILDNGEVLSGVAQGVNSHAELLVLIDGKPQCFNSAEVSVRAAENSSSSKSDATL